MIKWLNRAHVNLLTIKETSVTPLILQYHVEFNFFATNPQDFIHNLQTIFFRFLAHLLSHYHQGYFDIVQANYWLCSTFFLCVTSLFFLLYFLYCIRSRSEKLVHPKRPKWFYLKIYISELWYVLPVFLFSSHVFLP